jgi:SAM-dependent methyltransferase
MDRAQWLAERRAAVESDYTRDGETYDDGYDPATPTHRRFVSRLTETAPEGGTVLDAACGTSPYAGMVLGGHRRYVGLDQSAGMLERARAKWPDLSFERIGLQEVAFEGQFDGAMCIDAMEHVPPEEWPRVLAALRRALRPRGHLYLTVEEVDRRRLDAAFAEAVAGGAPVVRGEDIGDETGGYHFYPDRGEVDRWLADAHLRVVDEADEWLDGYGYRHLLLRVNDSAS